MSNRPPSPSPPEQPLLASDRRSATRYPCLWETPFRLGDEFGTAIVQDLSLSGAGMLLPRQVVPGMVVNVELLDQLFQCWRLKMVQVVHVTPHGSDQWLVGTLFDKKLTSEELHRLLR